MVSTDLRKIWLRHDLFAASFAINLLGVALPIMILQVYDRVLKNGSFSTLGALVAIVLAAFVLEFVLRLLRAAILNEAGSRFDHQVTQRGLQRLLFAGVEEFSKEPAATHTERFQAIQNVRNFYSQTALLLLTDLPFVGLFLILMVSISGWLTLVPVLFFAGLVVTAIGLSNVIRDVNRKQDDVDSRRHNFLVETLTGIHTVKGLTIEPLLQRRHERLQKASAESFAANTDLSGKVQTLSMIFGQGATAATVVIGSIFVVHGSLTIGGLAATTLLTGRILQPVLRGLTAFTRYQAIQIAEQKIRALEQLPTEPRGKDSLPKELNGALTVDHVTFAYGNGRAPILAGASLHIPARTTIGITGATASGKTTLAHLLCGLLTPQEGRVCIDGRPFSSFDPAELRTRIAVLPTHAVTYRGTILENMTGFRDGAIKEHALSLARELGLDDYVSTLPHGLDTVIGGSETLLPSGVAKRISIVRILANNPAVIILDNAHSGFDQNSDERLRRYFARIKGERTVILISQRPSYLALCDRLYGLQNGIFVAFDSVQAATALQRHEAGGLIDPVRKIA